MKKIVIVLVVLGLMTACPQTIKVTRVTSLEGCSVVSGTRTIAGKADYFDDGSNFYIILKSNQGKFKFVVSPRTEIVSHFPYQVHDRSSVEKWFLNHPNANGSAGVCMGQTNIIILHPEK